MAIADKNILITPNVSGILGNQPNVVFTGADSSIGDSAAITVTARPENSGTLSFTGTAGQLFSITNSLEGTIFAVNDVSGIPSLEIDDAGVIKMAEFNGRILLGGAIDDSSSLLQLSGHMRLNDNSEIKFGDDSDFVIFHNGGNSVIRDQGTGSLFIQTSRLIVEDLASNKSIDATDGGSVDLYHNENKKFETTSDGAMVTGELNVKEADDAYLIVHADTTTTPTSQLRLMRGDNDTFGTDGYVDWRIENGYGSGGSSGGTLTIGSRASGTTVNYVDFYASETCFLTDVKFDSANGIVFDKSDQSLKFGDNYFAKFGASSDLQIYHNGLHSYVRDQGTGHLYITTNGDFIHLGNGGALQSGKFSPAGAAELFYNGTERFETTDSGVNITGSLRVNNAELSTGASAGFAIAMAIAL